jgi:putative toxin-antitoxin system antitoxin component (TIGR02293 family)
MAGNKKPHANHHLSGNRFSHPFTDEHSQTATLEESITANAPRQNNQPSGPFNFESLTSQYKIGIVKNGITKKQLEAIKSETDFDYHTLSNLLAVSRTTLIKKKGEDKFDQPTSERIMLLAELISFGREVFESKELFNCWLKKPSFALGGKAPLELLDTIYGIAEVKKELGRIEYGVH